MKKPMEMFQFDERLYALNVEDVHQYDVPKIIDPNEILSDDTNSSGIVKCYEPSKKQLIQLSLIIWQVATRDRNRKTPRTREFELAEVRCTTTREILKSFLLPFVDGDVSKARDLCLTLIRINKENLDKYLCNWEIIPKPKDIWIDKNTRGIFIARSGDREVVGINPMNCVFVYNSKWGINYFRYYLMVDALLWHQLWDFFYLMKIFTKICKILDYKV